MFVEHQPERARFVRRLGHQEAVLEYVVSPTGKIDFFRTFVPDEHRGQGIAAALADAGLAWARERELEVEASCWYVAARLRGTGRA